MVDTRHNFLKKVICQRISEMSPGMKLPTELEFAQEFQVSRMTVNKVICELVKEGYVIRRRHHGTFVRERSMSAKIVTFLLPCPDDIINNSYSSFYRRGLLSGIMEAVKTTGCRLETLSVSPTNDINMTAAMAIMVLIYYVYQGVKVKGLKYFLHEFSAVGIIMALIELLEMVVRPFSLALRLFANILAGELLIVTFVGLCAYLLPLPFMFFEVFVAFVQALVFMLLSTAYIAMAAQEEEH